MSILACDACCKQDGQNQDLQDERMNRIKKYKDNDTPFSLSLECSIRDVACIDTVDAIHTCASIIASSPDKEKSGLCSELVLNIVKE